VEIYSGIERGATANAIFYVLPSWLMLFIVTPLGSRKLFRIFSIRATIPFRDSAGCGGSRKATRWPLGAMATRSPPLARLTSCENLQRTSAIGNPSMISAYQRSNHPERSRAAKFGDHCFAALQDDGVNAIQDQEIDHHGDGG
jgi:hypothetical protein